MYIFKTITSKASKRLWSINAEVVINHAADLNNLDSFVFAAEFRCALTTAMVNKVQNGTKDTIAILDYIPMSKRLILSAKVNKKPFNLYKKTICSYLNTESNCYLYINQVITKVLQYLDDEAVVQTDKINLKRIIFIFNTNGIIVFDSNGIFIFETDHFWSYNRNFNEVIYECQHSIDDKSRVLFDEPIVWPATQLVPTMDQMLAGPGTK